jgi:hypothetical protein
MGKAESDSNTMRCALALAIQILEELPDYLHPDSNIEDMRDLLAGVTTERDGFVVAEAVATALAFRAFTATTTKTTDDADAMTAASASRELEFAALFMLARHVSLTRLAFLFEQACRRIADAPPTG